MDRILQKERGKARLCIRSAQAFYDCCAGLGVHIFEGELIVGAIGEYRKCGILTPEFSWQWVDREMDNFATRPQDPYLITDEQRRFVREKIFPYWKGKSLEEAFLARLPAETQHIGVDTGIIDSDSKWRQAVGEVTPDYQDVLFKKGFGGIIREVQQHLAALDITNPEDEEKRDFYESVLLTYHRYGETKYDALGLPRPPAAFAAPTKAQLSGWEQLAAQEYGIKVTSYK